MPIFISHHGCLVHKRMCISCPLLPCRSSARRAHTNSNFVVVVAVVSVCWFSTRCIRRLLLSFVAYKRNIFLLICARPCVYRPAIFLREVFSLSRSWVLVSGHHIQPVHIGHKRPQPSDPATRNFNILCIRTNKIANVAIVVAMVFALHGHFFSSRRNFFAAMHGGTSSFIGKWHNIWLKEKSRRLRKHEKIKNGYVIRVPVMVGHFVFVSR